MFSKKIQGTPLTTDLVSDYFTIKGSYFSGDVSFVATLRALLHERCCREEVTLFIHSDSVLGLTTIPDLPPERLFAHFSSILPCDGNALNVVNLTGSQEEVEYAFSLFDNSENGFSAIYPDYPEAKDLGAFVRNRARLNARFYVNKDGKRATIVCDNLALPTYHFLQSLTPRLLPHFFENAPLDEEEFSLLDSLTFRTAVKYEERLAVLADRIDFREYAVRKVIGDFEREGRREEIRRTEENIARLRAEMEGHRDRYRDCLARIYDMNFRLAGQEIALRSASSSSELIDYIIHNRNITPLRTSGRVFLFAVKTFLESFDPEQFRTYSQNIHSFLYEGYECSGRFEDMESRKKMLEAIFSDEPTLKVKICSNYSLDLRGSCSCNVMFCYGDEFSDYIPNPHIHYFACLGNYAVYIDRALQKGDTIGAIEQCVASAKSLNLAEAPTVRKFLSDVFNSHHKIIRLPDGRDVTPEEALDYLNSLEKEEGESNV